MLCGEESIKSAASAHRSVASGISAPHRRLLASLVTSPNIDVVVRSSIITGAHGRLTKDWGGLRLDIGIVGSSIHRISPDLQGRHGGQRCTNPPTRMSWRLSALRPVKK